MKSHSDNLLHVVGGILTDVARAYPTLKGLDLDFERLSRLNSSRGLGCFTLDLPARESALLQGLESGLLRSEGTLVYSKRYKVPRLFAGLYMRIFDRDLRLKSDADVNAIMFLRQLLCLGKKIEVPCSAKRKFQAIKDYINVEQQLIAPTLQWGRDSLDCHSVRSRVHLCDNLGLDLPLYPEYNIGRTAREKLLLNRCQQVADYVAEELGTFCPDCFIEARRADGRRLGLRHGPGAVAEKRGRFFDKNLFTNWSAKLSRLYPFSLTGKMPNDERIQPLNHEAPAYLHCVPKTAKGPRIIAAEPSEHMFCQNLFADWLIERIDSTYLSKFINFRDQALSGKLVLKASLDRELATIDLSSASDRLSLYVVERMFRNNPSILTAIHAGRTRWLRLPNGECLELRKFASQGTALTFPIQTLVFFVIAMAVSLDKPMGPKSWKGLVGKVRVFGDDIIVPTTGYVEIVELLTTLQLKVNSEKSFSRGYFRESCGVDAFKGYDITPVKPKTTISDSPASCQAVLDTINNLFCKGYWNASEQLEHRQPSRNLSGYGLVGRVAGASGFISFMFDSYINGWLLKVSAVSQQAPSIKYEIRREVRSVLQRFDNLDRRSGFGRNRPLERLLRVRWSHKLCRIEVRQAAISSHSKERAFTCGYSGLLRRQLQPSDPQSLTTKGILGVPERPNLRKVIRWEGLESLCSRA